DSTARRSTCISSRPARAMQRSRSAGISPNCRWTRWRDGSSRAPRWARTPWCGPSPRGSARGCRGPNNLDPASEASLPTIARHYESGRWVRVATEGPTIAAVEPVEKPLGIEDEWIAPAFWDLQVNGRWGVSFSDHGLTIEQVAAIVRAQ